MAAGALPYNHTPMSRVLSSSAVACTVLLAWSSGSEAQPRRPAPAAKPVRACGIAAVPLSVGNSWTYDSLPPPTGPGYEGFELSEAQRKMVPIQPAKLTIKVDKIVTEGATTTITLTEDHDGRIHTTTATCGGGKLVFAPNAFWFSGEPGDTYGITLSDVERKGSSLDLIAGKLSLAPEWHDDLKATWKHDVNAKYPVAMRSGTLTVTRHFVMQAAEDVDAGMVGKWKANKFGLDSVFNVTIEPAPEKPLVQRNRVVNYLFQVDGVGIVQVVNRFGRMYRLSAFTVQ